MRGSIKGAKITLLDLNNNGIWNEIGTDGMIVGKGSAASFLSKVISVKGNLFALEVTADGRSMTAKPFEGESGKLNLRKSFKSQGSLLAAVVSSESGDYSFNLANAKRGMTVPTGRYTLTGGYLKRGGASVRMRAGKMRAIEVASDQPLVLAWGSPLKAEFSYARNGTKITIEPASLKYYDKVGIEFFGWAPDVKSPKFFVNDKKTGKELDSGRFGGC
jgi:hypothetical protein